MKRKISEIRKRLEKALTSRNVSSTDAKVIADEYLTGELQGKLSHGLMAFPSLLSSLAESFKKPKIILKTHSLLVIEANRNLGTVVGKFAVDKLTAMAKKEGVAVALIKNMTTWLRPGTIARFIAEKNMVGLVFNNGGRPMTAAPGGFEPVIGTNPIGIAIPTDKQSIIADMATSKRAWGEVKKAEREGTKLPKETYFTKEGKFAENPGDAYSVVPAGDYKGFALGLLIEILTGSFMDRAMGKVQMTGDYRAMTRGGVIIILNPEKTVNVRKFKKSNSQIVKEIKESKKLDDIEEIFLPGERSNKKKDRILKQGWIEVENKLWEKLQ